MDKNKFMSILFFVLSIASPMIAFYLTSMIGEVKIFDIGGIIRYSYVMWFFIPIGVISVVFGKILKNKGCHYKKNTIAGYISIFIVFLFGSYRFIFRNMYTFDTNQIKKIEEKVDFIFPNNIKVATANYNSYDISYIKIYDNDKNEFEYELKSNGKWTNKADLRIITLLPITIQYELEMYDYFLFYNITKDEYNFFPSSGEYDCIFFFYDSKLQKVLIIHDYRVVLE